MSENKKSAKVWARIFCYEIPASLPDGSIKFTVEYKLMTGDRQAGKAIFTIANIASDDQLSDDLREALAEHLTATYGSMIKPRDIVGYSI